MIDEAEIREMATLWGEPAREQVRLEVAPEFWLPWEGKWESRRGEVLFLLPRPGGLLLHRKHHYPDGAWRLLTGGIERGEPVWETIAREPEEEVGLALPVRRYVALLSYEIVCEGRGWPWATHIFLLPWSDAPLQPSHDDEIAATTVAPLSGLPAVAGQLEGLASPWRAWGRFRALAHRAVARHLRPGECQRD